MVVPAYNESRGLPALCERVRAALAGSGTSYALHVVDDGSGDGTAEAARRLAAAHPLRLHVHARNRGVAAAFLTGLRAALEGAAEDDAVAVLEADGTCDPTLLPALLAALAPPCDVAIASRHAPGGGYRRFPLKRLALSLAANALLRRACGLPGVRDYTIFYRAYRAGPLRRALAACGDRFTSVGGFACNAEMLLRLSPFVRTAREVPLVYDYGVKRSASAMRTLPNLLSYAALLRVYFREIRKG